MSKKEVVMVRRAFLIIVMSLVFLQIVAAGVIEPKLWSRNQTPIVFTPSDVTQLMGGSIPEFYLWSWREGGWTEVVFQVDEMDENPGWTGYTPNPFWNYFIWDDLDNGTEPMAGDGFFSSHDEIVMIAEELGDRVTADEWPPGVPTDYNRLELSFSDPLNPGDAGWVYLFRDPSTPSWITDDDVDWIDETGMEKTIIATGYSVSYISSGPDSWFHSPTFDSISITPYNGGDGVDLLDVHKTTANIRVWIFDVPFCQNGTGVETYFQDESSYRPHWVWGVRDGPVRVIRQYRMRGQVNGSQWGYHPYYTCKYYKYSMHINERFYINTTMTWNWGETSFDHNEAALPMTYRDQTGNIGVIDGDNTNDAVTNGAIPDWVLITSAHGSYHMTMDVASVQCESMTGVWNDDGSGATEAGYCQDDNGRFGDFGYRWIAPLLLQNTYLNWYYTFLPNTTVDSRENGDIFHQNNLVPIPAPGVAVQSYYEPTPTPTPECVHHGDVDFSGGLSAGDAQMIFNIVLGTYVPTYQEACAADCDGNGSVSAGDSQQVFFTVLGMLPGCLDPV